MAKLTKGCQTLTILTGMKYMGLPTFLTMDLALHLFKFSVHLADEGFTSKVWRNTKSWLELYFSEPTTSKVQKYNSPWFNVKL